MMDILLTSKALKIAKIKRRTSAKFFKDLKVGDEIKVVGILRDPGRSWGSSSNGLYATYFNVVNETTGEMTRNSLTMLSKLLANFEFE